MILGDGVLSGSGSGGAEGLYATSLMVRYAKD